jgi:hypothetical protein
LDHGPQMTPGSFEGIVVGAYRGASLSDEVGLRRAIGGRSASVWRGEAPGVFSRRLVSSPATEDGPHRDAGPLWSVGPHVAIRWRSCPEESLLATQGQSTGRWGTSGGVVEVGEGPPPFAAAIRRALGTSRSRVRFPLGLPRRPVKDSIGSRRNSAIGRGNYRAAILAA